MTNKSLGPISRYSVSLVYQRHQGQDLHQRLEVQVVSAISRDEALGLAISRCIDKVKSYQLAMHVVVQIEDKP